MTIDPCKKNKIPPTTTPFIFYGKAKMIIIYIYIWPRVVLSLRFYFLCPKLIPFRWFVPTNNFTLKGPLCTFMTERYGPSTEF
jgi:hypothetical protein